MKPYIKYYKSGLIRLLITTEDRWCEYDVSVNEVRGKCIVEEWDGNGENIYIKHEIDVEFEDGVLYHRIKEKKKDQIYVYFIPYNLLEE